jgi:cytochrome c oxidase subunit 3
MNNPNLAPPYDSELEGTVFDRHVLEHQFANLGQQHEVATIGMWVFLVTEVMFFGALFLGVAVYRYKYPEAFERASAQLNVTIGGINTIVLLVSSLMMALAVHNAQLGRQKHLTVFLVLTAVLGLVFLVFKGLEYYLDYEEYLIPGWRFKPEEWTRPTEDYPAVNPYHVQLFLMFYWIMTGLHALHVTIGILVVFLMAWLAGKGKFSADYYSPVEVTGLYWHFVDLVWIFLLPMLYLLGTHSVADIHLF